MKKPSLAVCIDILLFILLVIASVIYHMSIGSNLAINGLNEIVNGLLLYLSITIGFFGTSISVLISIMEKDFMSRFFQNKAVKTDFISIMYLVILSGAISIMYSIFLVIMNSNGFEFIYNIYIISFYIFLIFIYSLNILYMTLLLLNGLSDLIKKL